MARGRCAPWKQKEVQPGPPGLGTRSWVTLRGPAAPPAACHCGRRICRRACFLSPATSPAQLPPRACGPHPPHSTFGPRVEVSFLLSMHWGFQVPIPAPGLRI